VKCSLCGDAAQQAQSIDVCRGCVRTLQDGCTTSARARQLELALADERAAVDRWRMIAQSAQRTVDELTKENARLAQENADLLASAADLIDAFEGS
jgi:hypothetical protein